MGRIIAIIPTDHYGAVNLGNNVTNMVSIAEEDKDYINNYFKTHYGYGVSLVMTDAASELNSETGKVQAYGSDLVIVPIDDLSNENIPKYALGTLSENNTYEDDLILIELTEEGCSEGFVSWLDLTNWDVLVTGTWDGIKYISGT